MISAEAYQLIDGIHTYKEAIEKSKWAPKAQKMKTMKEMINFRFSSLHVRSAVLYFLGCE